MRKNNPPKKAYVNINFYKLLLSELKLSEFVVAQIIEDLSKQNGVYFGSRNYLGNCTGFNVRTIRIIIKKLIEKDYIIKDPLTNYLKVTGKFLTLNNTNAYLDDDEFYGLL